MSSGNNFVGVQVTHLHPTFLHNNNSSEHQQYQQQHQDESAELPQWIQDYMSWHTKIRTKYPGRLLFTEDTAPGLLIRGCLVSHQQGQKCGGLHDRIGSLPWDIYLANQTGRVLLFWWDDVSLLEFLSAGNNKTKIDWTVPVSVARPFLWKHNARLRTIPRGYKTQHAKNWFNTFGTNDTEAVISNAFWQNRRIDEIIRRDRETADPSTRVVWYYLVGHLREPYLEERLRELGETDTIHWTPTFGRLYQIVFAPSQRMQSKLDSIRTSLKLKPHQYSAVHVRARHPKAFEVSFLSPGGDSVADVGGLPWGDGPPRTYAVSVATQAIQCLKSIVVGNGSQNRAMLLQQQPFYFMADSNDLVRYISHELTDVSFVKANSTRLQSSEVDMLALQAVREVPRIVARPMASENLHLDRQEGFPAEAYDSVFLDLFLAWEARCLSYGLGWYGMFAAKLSGTRCKVLYQEEGRNHEDQRQYKRNHTPACLLGVLQGVGKNPYDKMEFRTVTY